MRSILVGILLFLTTSGFAADLTVGRQMISTRSVEDLVSVITDYSQFCRSGSCAYMVPSIREFRVLEKNESETFMWQAVEGTVKSFVFYKAVTQKNDDGSVVITTTYPNQSELEYLTSSYSLAGEQPFDSFKAEWIVRPVNEGNTEVKYSNVVSSRNLARPSFRRIVEQELNSTIADYFRNLDLNKTWMTCLENNYCKNGWGWVEEGIESLDFGNKVWICSPEMKLSWKGEGCSCRCK